jgi:hypothetical protein
MRDPVTVLVVAILIVVLLALLGVVSLHHL